MITGELKNKIDGIWNTLFAAGVSNPITAVDQITYLIFIKLLDDKQMQMEANEEVLGIKTSKNKVFGTGKCVISETPLLEIDYSQLRWHNIKNLEPNEMIVTVRDYVFPFIKQLGTGKYASFYKYLDNIVFMIPTAQVLSKVVDGVSQLDMNNLDIMGDLYEYLLSKLSAAGTAGMFRTPRHIIEMMVDITKPNVDDTILDPAMGSAGFLVGCAKYIEEEHKKELLNQNVSKHFNSSMFTGFDTSDTMLRIGAMNMLLHGVESPIINYQDSLSYDNTERSKYSLIMANPPFKGSIFQENVNKDLLTICKTKKTELLFVALFVKMLKTGGRCACIVPDGVLFGSDKAAVAIRKELVENQKLIAVISMPSGVFKPYAGVSTAILYFMKTDNGGTDKVWYYDMKADGYSLDDKRTVISDNDIPDILKRVNNLDKEEKRKRTDQSFLVPKQDIRDNNYDLSINKYKETKYEHIEYPPTEEILAEIMKLDEEANKELKKLAKMLKK